MDEDPSTVEDAEPAPISNKRKFTENAILEILSDLSEKVKSQATKIESQETRIETLRKSNSEIKKKLKKAGQPDSHSAYLNFDISSKKFSVLEFNEDHFKTVAEHGIGKLVEDIKFEDCNMLVDDQGKFLILRSDETGWQRVSTSAIKGYLYDEFVYKFYSTCFKLMACDPASPLIDLYLKRQIVSDNDIEDVKIALKRKTDVA